MKTNNTAAVEYESVTRLMKNFNLPDQFFSRVRTSNNLPSPRYNSDEQLWIKKTVLWGAGGKGVLGPCCRAPAPGAEPPLWVWGRSPQKLE